MRRSGRPLSWHRAAGHAPASWWRHSVVAGPMATLWPAARSAELRGRRRECDLLNQLLDSVHAGEPGPGGARGTRGGQDGPAGLSGRAGVGLPGGACGGGRIGDGAGLRRAPQLVTPMLDRLERLPAPQANALQTAFGLRSGSAPDRFLVELAALSLLAEVAEEHPLVCLVDDTQWLDQASAQVLGFVARRLAAESVILVFAARVLGDELAGLPELVVESLQEADARALLNSVLTGPLDPRVHDRILAEAAGNPLALVELPRGVTPAELAGGFALPDAIPLPGRIEESFRRRLEVLPDDTRRLLQLAAAEPVGDPVLMWRAAERLGIATQATTLAAEAGLVEFGARVGSGIPWCARRPTGRRRQGGTGASRPGRGHRPGA